MQQTQQILLSVKHKLPEPNSILPSELIKSEQARHLRKRVHDVPALSSYNWPLDRGCQSSRDRIGAILSNYYGTQYNISQLLKWQHKIVFLNPMVHPSECEDDNYYFGSISSSIIKPRQSACNPLVHQSTYELQFDDKIQSGNLYFALQHEPQVYLLANRLDYNTRSYGQWFYFKVKNVTDTSGLFKFCIVNMTKNGTMFGKGLKVSVCRKGVWSKEGTQIEYIQNKFMRKSSVRGRPNIFGNAETYFTLAFTLPIDAHQSIYVAYNQPYTYTKLCQKLDSIMSHSINVSRSVIARTPLGNRIEIVTITNKNTVANKKIIFITARAHPVETAGSFVAQGIIDELLAPTNPELVNQLLDNYLIKIVPMINPDGVIVGNSRCNIYGFDLNRQWKDPVKNTAPEILSLKRAILKYEGRIQMFLDLHGHSTKKNVFAYGCHDVKNPIASRQFPYLLSKFSTTDFVYSQCRFTMLTQSKNNGKDGTARVSLWRKLKIPNIFTIQNSYCCAEGSQYHYDSRSYGSIGRDIVVSLCSYFQKPDPNPQKNALTSEQSTSSDLKMAETEILSKSLSFNRETLLSDLRNNASLVNFNIRTSSEVSSESQPEDRIEIQQVVRTPKKLNRDISSKVYMKSKGEKVNREGVLKNNGQLIRISKNVTIEPKTQKAEEGGESPSRSGQKFRRKYLRNLSPLTKESMPVKLIQTQSNNSDCPMLTKRGDSQPQLNKQRNASLRQTKTNTISIIHLGVESDLSGAKDNYEMLKATSAKNINSEYGIYHTRLNTLSGSHSQKKNTVNYLKNIICPGADVETFCDSNQFRQPVLKVKKNLCRNVSKLQQFISKINTIQTNMSIRNFGSNNAPLVRQQMSINNSSSK